MASVTPYLSDCLPSRKASPPVMPCGWKGNRRGIHFRAIPIWLPSQSQGITGGDGMVSHWPCTTDINWFSTCVLKAWKREMSIHLCTLVQYNELYLTVPLLGCVTQWCFTTVRLSLSLGPMSQSTEAVGNGKFGGSVFHHMCNWLSVLWLKGQRSTLYGPAEILGGSWFGGNCY